MADNGFFFGPIETAPAALRKPAGSLLPAAVGAKIFILHVPDGVHCTEIEPIHLSDPSTHLCVMLERGARAEIAVWLEGEGNLHHTAEIIAADESSCTLLSVNAASRDAEVAIKQQSWVGSGARVQWQNVTLGGKTVEQDLVSRVTGHDGESGIDWMFYAKDSEKQTLTVRNIFDGANGIGEILMRGIAEGKGHTVCKGLIDIGLKGGGTNTYLTQEVLMLDPQSNVDAIPALEIKTNDVKASHSATVARVTEEDLFYFGARGIDPNSAREMFVLGFLGDITQRVADADACAAVVAAIEAKYRSSAVQAEGAR